MEDYYEVIECPMENTRKATECPIGNNIETTTGCPDTEQTHVHEFEESTKLAEEGEDRHNHRVAGVTGEVIPVQGGHIHPYGVLNTDFLDHHHEIGGLTGIDIPIPNTNKHIHLMCGVTTCNDGHNHRYLFTTQIDSPLV